MLSLRRRRTSVVLGLILASMHSSVLSTAAAASADPATAASDQSKYDLLHPDDNNHLHHKLHDVTVHANYEREDGTVERRQLRQAEWRPWPAETIRNLPVHSNLCVEGTNNWPKALHKAKKQWNQRSQGAVSLRVKQGKCDLALNKDLTYIENAIHVVYGTCGADCCGKADVEYSYNDEGITSYAALVRIDRECFPQGGEFYGLQYILCHELGHAIGLAHDYGVGSCMGGFYDGKKPGKGDIQTLLDLYGDNLVQEGRATSTQP